MALTRDAKLRKIAALLIANKAQVAGLLNVPVVTPAIEAQIAELLQTNKDLEVLRDDVVLGDSFSIYEFVNDDNDIVLKQ